MTLSRELCVGTVDVIVDRLGLTELPGETTPERMVLTSPMVPDGPVGAMRIWRKADVVDLVYVGLTVPMIGLDSHMMFAFTTPTSAVPHFTLDSIMGGGGPPPGAAPGAPPVDAAAVDAAAEERAEFAFHLDLIPKLDLGANLSYMDHCFGPLTALLEKGEAIDGLTPAKLSPRQYAVMSAWMFVHRADESAFRAISEIVDAYRDHWFDLVEAGIDAAVLDGTTSEQVAERDRRNRAIVFDPDVDPVWGRVARLVGEDVAETVRSTLAVPLSTASF